MKKLTSFVLALAMAAVCAAPAMTEGSDGTLPPASSDTKITEDSTDPKGSTTVKFNIAPAYTVEIPATVTLDKQEGEDGVTYEKDLPLKASNVRLEKGKELQVTIPTGSTFQLSAGKATLDYTITITVDNKQETVTAGSVVANFETDTADQTQKLHIKAGNPDFAGNYSGTLTFAIAVADANTTT